jgi:hypothetical protein
MIPTSPALLLLLNTDQLLLLVVLNRQEIIDKNPGIGVVVSSIFLCLRSISTPH